MQYHFKITGKVPSKKNSYIPLEGRMIKSTKVTDFNTGASWEMIPQKKKQGIKEPIDEEMRVDITFYCDRRSDLDNMVTTIFDLLQEAGVIANDRLITELHASRIKSKELQTNISIETYDE